MWRLVGFLLIILIAAEGFCQESKEILEKHFTTVGQDLWDQISDVTVDGRWVDENYRGYRIELSCKRPNKLRIEGRFGGRPFIEATDGTVAWILAPWKSKYEAQEMQTVEQLLLENSFSLGSPLYPLQDRLIFGGLQNVEGALYLTFILEERGIKRTFFLGRKDYKLYLERYSLNNQEIIKIYEKYREYNGLVFPTAIRFEGPDLERELVYDEVFIGVGINDDIFKLPKSP